jgi:protein-disulfide isomerase
MHKMKLPELVAFCCVVVAVHVFAFEQKKEVPDTLTAKQAAYVDSLEKTVAVDGCSKRTLYENVRESTPCPLAKHLHDFIRWDVARETADTALVPAIQKHYQTLCSTEKSVIDTTKFPIVGDKKAPVLIIGYVTATCPFCHYVTKALYEAVTTGILKGKARLMIKPFGATTQNHILAAALQKGKYFDLFLAIADVKVRLDPPLMLSIADSIGLSSKELMVLAKGAKADSLVLRSLAEAKKNDVPIAPTFFINHIRYKGFKDPKWLIDAALYRYETGVLPPKHP